MSEMMCTDTKVIDSEFRNGLFGLQYWIKEECEDWDTNTGMTGPMYIRWRKATKSEREHLVRYQR